MDVVCNQGEATFIASTLAFIRQAIGGLSMTERVLPTPEMLRKLLRYEHETGRLFWRERTPDMFSDGGHTAEHNCAAWNSKNANSEAFATDCDGYRTGKISGANYKSHRVIWAMEASKWPDGDIDHINHNRADNRWKNLRESTRLENLRNQSLRSDNTSGHLGVCWSAANGKWMAQIKADGKQQYLGLFTDITEAILARAAADIKYGFHANHGR